jgi:polar amino acid transport system substrate-binding protein
MKPALTTLAAGKLTVGADNPAYPPYYQIDDPAVAPWELGNPTNGKGLESATAYAVAERLGFAQADVTWVPVPFNNAIQPGTKAFDMYLTQVSYSPERAEAVDLSEGYFDLNQSVVTLEDNPIAKVTDVAGLKAFKLGSQVGTTSFRYITDTIQPTAAPMAYDSMDAAISALKAKQIDGIVADLPTAFYMRDAQLSENGGVIVGSLPTVGEPEHFSILLGKDSPLTDCVNQALASMKADGSLQAIVDEWITGQGAPVLE